MHVPLFIDIKDFDAWVESYVSKFKLPVKSITLHPDVYTAMEHRVPLSTFDRKGGTCKLTYISHERVIDLIRGTYE